MLQKFLKKFKQDPEKYLLVALVFSLPFERIPSFEFGGITMRVSLFISGILILRCLYLIWKRKLSIRLLTPEKILLLFMVWIILLIPEAINIKRALQVVVFNAFTLTTAFAIALTFQKKYIRPILISLFWSAALVTLFGVYQYFGDLFGLPNNITGLRDRYSWQVFGFPRIQATALEPLYFASYLMLPISMLISLISLKSQKILSTKKALLLLAFLSFGMFLTVSRGGVIAIIIAMVFIAAVTTILKLTNLKSVLTMIGVILTGFVMAFMLITFMNKPPADLSFTKGHKGGNAFTNQLQNAGLEGGGDERSKARENAFMILKENRIAWLIGIGPGQYGPYVQHNQINSFGWTIVNNLTLELLVEVGLVGLGLIVLFFVILCLKLLQLAYKNSQMIEVVLALGLVAFFIAEAVQYQTFSTLYLMQIWIAAGIAMGYQTTKLIRKK